MHTIERIFRSLANTCERARINGTALVKQLGITDENFNELKETENQEGTTQTTNKKGFALHSVRDQHKTADTFHNKIRLVIQVRTSLLHRRRK